MAAVPVTIDGVLYDLFNRTTQRVILMGDASLTGLSVGGGPVIPPPGQPPGGGLPPGWGYLPIAPGGPAPTPPISGGWYPGGSPLPPWYGDKPVVPPDFTPPPPGSVVVLPGNHPVQPIVAPPFIIVQYPGVGPVVITNPQSASK